MRISIKPKQTASDEEKQRYLKQLAEELEVDLPVKHVSPVEEILKLEDDPQTMYFWKTREGVTQQEISTLVSEIYSRFVRTNKRDPKSIHFVGKQLEDIKKYNAEEIEKLLFPWLKAEIRRKLTKP